MFRTNYCWKGRSDLFCVNKIENLMSELKDCGKSFRLLSFIYGFRGVAIPRLSYTNDNNCICSGTFKQTVF